MKIGDNIKKYRKLKGLTQSELAHRIKMSKSTIEKYESDELGGNLMTLRHIAKALDVDINDLISQEKNTPKNGIIEYKEFATKLRDLADIIDDFDKEFENGWFFIKGAFMAMTDDIDNRIIQLEDSKWTIKENDNGTRRT